VTCEQLAGLIKSGAPEADIKDAIKLAFSYKENIDVFSYFFFPHVFKVKKADVTTTTHTPGFHKEIYDLLFNAANDALAAPRGHAKSTIAGLFFIIYSVAYRLEEYIVYTSQNHAKTTQFLTPIRHEFKHNELLRWVYGDLTPWAAKDDDGKDRDDCFDVNGIRIEAVSFEKNIRGFKYKNYRPSLIILDDIEDGMRLLNPELRIKDANKLNMEIIPALAPHGRYKFIGTILHPDSLLINKIKQLNGKTFKAIMPDGTTLWPEVYDKEKLDQVKKEIGSIAFEQEYLNNPIDTTHNLIKREWVLQCFREDVSHEDVLAMEFKLKLMGVDFAFADRVTADESCFGAIGVKDDFYYLLHMQKEQGWSIDTQMKHIKNVLHEKYSFDQIGLEENSIKAVSKDLSQYNLPLTLFWTSASDPVNKLTDYKQYDFLGKRHTVGKTNLILRLGTSFENKRWIIPYKTEADKVIADRLLAECTSYALADGKLVEAGIHPDIPIAIGYAVELATNYEKAVFDFG